MQPFTWHRFLLILILVASPSYLLIDDATPGFAQETGLQNLSQATTFSSSKQAEPLLTSSERSTDLLVDNQSIAAGASHTCALTWDGGVKCWGSNSGGQLGDGTLTDRWQHASVTGLDSGVQAIAAGSAHTCALTAEGGVKCWGWNAYGQLGDGTTTDRLIPVNVSGLSSGVQAIATGNTHTCALTVGGGIKCWGYNEFGQLGDISTTDRWTPVDVSEFPSGIQAIAAGKSHTCALTTGGGVKCWGRNNYGQLGDEQFDNWRLTPVDVSGLSSDVQAIGAGDSHTCALTIDGGVKCWGYGDRNQLGDGTTGNMTWLPVEVKGLNNDVHAIAIGFTHSCALTRHGGVKCWGDNSSGQLGDGTITARLTAVDVFGLSSGIRSISAGGRHTCAMTAGSLPKCWGNNDDGQLGVSGHTFVYQPTPVSVDRLDDDIQAIVAGSDHTCALTAVGGLKCWGSNVYGQLGDGTITDRSEPMSVTGLDSDVQAVAAGNGHTCALTTGGGVKCWGRNSYGQLGDGTITDQLIPVVVDGLGSGISAITAGGSHTCALTAAGGVKCWGRNHSGQLGDGTVTDRWTPVNVNGIGSAIQAITAGQSHTCALTMDGRIKCWGRNDWGQLGDSPSLQLSLTPLDVRRLGNNGQAVGAGGIHTCALTKDNGAKCWGGNSFGQLGDGTNTKRWTPLDVTSLSSGVQTIAVGFDHSCAVTTVGGVKCWGSNNFGRLGDGTTTNRWTPVDVSELDKGIQAIAAGQSHTCALTEDGMVQCWGYNNQGRLGVNSGMEPLDVLDFPVATPLFLPLIVR